MAGDNDAIADRLERYAALLELSGADTHSVRAYRRAADTVRALPAPVSELVRAGRARELRGIGPSIEARLRELVDTGRLLELEQLEDDVRPELVAVGRLVGLSPARATAAGHALGIHSGAELREAAEAGRLRDVPGIGPVTEAKVLAAFAAERPTPRVALTLNRALALSGAFAEALGGIVAGDPRRFRELSERLAVVVASVRPDEVAAAVERLPQVVSVLGREAGRVVALTVEGIPVEVVAAPPHGLGTALVRATGSEAYVAALGELPDAPDEHALFRALGLPYLPPELREAPFAGAPPALVEAADVRGDLHVHTTWSDGRASVLEMGRAARELGYEYVAICDHTPAVGVVPGLDADAVRRQGEEIAAANEQLAPFRVLRGIECDILADGTLDLSDDVLAELDWVQASVHAGQRQPAAQLTHRMTEAARHPAVRSISHPQGRILGRRPPNAVDLERLFEVCRETGTAVETNGLPDRLDLSGELVREAIAAGVAITAGSDSHSVAGLANMRLAVGTARRGWATAADVLNTRPLAEILRR